MQRALLAASLSWALAGTTLAQTPQQVPQQTPQNSGPGPSAESCAKSGGSGDLSNKLSQSNGVICPPDVDPAMKAPTPDTGRMPVIPPPGSPGGNQNVQPK